MPTQIDIENTTLSKIKEMKAKQLDKKFKTKYPKGKFTLHIREKGKYNDYYSEQKRLVELSRETRRRTASCAYPAKCISSCNKKIKFHESVNNSFGLVKNFNNLKSLIECTKRYKVYPKLIEEFVKLINTK